MSNKRFPNPYESIPVGQRFHVEGRIAQEVGLYFFRECLPGCHGAANAMIATFFHKFHEACRTDEIAGPWDPALELRVLEVLNRMSFTVPTKPAKSRRKKTVAG